MQRRPFAAAVAVAAVVFFVAKSAEAHPGYCTHEQEAAAPCKCCKMMCWYVVADEDRLALGHQPGASGELEALRTLMAIKACIVERCADTCKAAPPSRVSLGE